MAKQTAAQKAVARKDISYWEYTKREMKRNWIAYFMILPYLIIFTLFTLCPVVLSLVLPTLTCFNGQTLFGLRTTSTCSLQTISLLSPARTP